MKKMTILIVVMFITSATIFGQGFGLGLKGGLNFANVNYSNASLSNASSSKTGFHLGVFARVMVTGKFGIQPEAHFSVQGSKLSVGSIKSELNTSYLQIPILLRFSPISLINIHAGPQFGILLKAEEKVGSAVTGVKNNFKNRDFALAFGVGLDLPLGLNLTLRYIRGLNNIDNTTSSNTLKNNMFQIAVGYQLIGLGK